MCNVMILLMILLLMCVIMCVINVCVSSNDINVCVILLLLL